MALALVPPKAASPTPTPERIPSTEYFKDLGIEKAFEAYYRVSKGETGYKVAKDLGIDQGTVTRVINGDHRAERRPKPSFTELLNLDPEFKARYEAYARSKDTSFESQRWDRRGFNSISMIRDWHAAKIRSNSRSQIGNIAVLKRVLTGELFPEFKCSPERFILDLDPKKPSEVMRFVDLYLQKTGAKKVPNKISIAIRDFLSICHQINIPRNQGHLYGLSGAKDSYGKHNTKMLSNTQWTDLLTTLLQQGNLKLAAKTAIGCEGFPRSETLNNLKPSSFQLKHREIDGQLCQYYIFEKMENKTAKHKQTPFNAEIFQPVAIEIVKAYLETYKPSLTMFLDGLNNSQSKKQDHQFNQTLKAIYKQLGITDPYYFNYPTYTFRHTGAQRMVKRCGGNYAIVAKRGWLDTKTLQDCYAGLQGDDDFDTKTCYECHPPNHPLTDEERFCSLKCTVLYYTKHYQEIIAPFMPLIQAAKEAGQ